MYCKCILLVVFFFCIQYGDSVGPLQTLEGYFNRENKKNVLPYDAYVSYVRQNYNLPEHYNKLVNEIGERYKHGISKEEFIWAISTVDSEVKYPQGYTPNITSGSRHLAELIEKSKAMDKNFDGHYFDKNQK